MRAPSWPRKSVRTRWWAPLVLAAAGALPAAATGDLPGWPEVKRESRPWTRWWWPGSAVHRAGVTRQLELFSRAGLGGVEITPIYGARGAEARYLTFLSPAWMDMLKYTALEARRLGLGVDMVTGTGWPFGGPWVTAADGSESLVLENGRLAGRPTDMKVKRAAPGDEGLVIDPYSTTAIAHYLAPFSAALADFPRGLVRSQFHDSFEYFGAEWSPDLPATFQRLHGYDLQDHAAALLGKTPLPDDQLARLKGDYRATLAQMHLEYLRAWVRWSHEHGFLVRNQSHGAPGNLLDLYGTVDIPETETFGSTPFPIPGFRRDPADVASGQDLPEPLIMRMASSAAHVMGRPYASSETCTWLREHWKAALAFTKPEIDRLFVNGINHVFYHGTAYSPPDAPWPGWFFYASTEFYPTNTWWDDFGALNHYVARVQSVLQAGGPDNEVLLYWPFADVIDNPKGLMLQFAVHRVRWLTDSAFGRTAHALVHNGYAFDYVSDAQLAATTFDHGALVTPGGTRYRMLLVPATRRMPLATLRQLLQLARAGAPIHLLALPEDVPGLGTLEKRRAEFHHRLDEVRALATRSEPSLLLGPGSMEAGLDRAFLSAHATREPLADAGLEYIRRKSAEGWDYFVVNQGAQPFDGWVALGPRVGAAALLDPLSDRAGEAALRRTPAGTTEIYLQLAPDESLIVRATSAPFAPAAATAWPYVAAAGAPVPLAGRWDIKFIAGGPELPPGFETAELKSWTELGGEEAQRFAGTARYTLAFDAPATQAGDWLLDLGDVRESARVRLNGREVATAWSLPFRVRVGSWLQPGRNVLELEVTNLAANRIRDLDRRKVPWKIMREINIVNIHYRPFDASNWPLTPSGLLGPVTLTPVELLHPQ